MMSQILRLRNQQVGSSSLPAGSRFQGVRTMVLAPFSFFSGSTCWLLWLMGLVWYPTAPGSWVSRPTSSKIVHRVQQVESYPLRRTCFP